MKRLDFVGGDDCDMEEEKGRLLWEHNPKEVPSKFRVLKSLFMNFEAVFFISSYLILTG